MAASATGKFGLSLDPRLGWFLMELPATLSFLFFFLPGRAPGRARAARAHGDVVLHYSNRGFLFPLLMRVPRARPRASA